MSLLTVTVLLGMHHGQLVASKMHVKALNEFARKWLREKGLLC